MIASNHKSQVDPFFVGHAFPRSLRYFAKSELFGNGALRWAVNELGGIPVRRGQSDRSALEAALAALAQGDALIIFPEGTRMRDGDIHQFQPGVGMLAIRSGAPVIPVAIKGSDYRSATAGPVCRSCGSRPVLQSTSTACRGRRVSSTRRPPNGCGWPSRSSMTASDEIDGAGAEHAGVEIVVARYAGYCYGVERALRIADEAGVELRPPISTLGPLIHNPAVVERLARRGIAAVDSLDQVEGGTVIVRTHGIDPEVIAAAGHAGSR